MSAADDETEDGEVEQRFANLRHQHSRVSRARGARLEPNSVMQRLEEHAPDDSPEELLQSIPFRSLEQLRELSQSCLNLTSEEVAEMTREQLVSKLSSTLLVVNTLWADRRRKVRFVISEEQTDARLDRITRAAFQKWRGFARKRVAQRRLEEKRAAK